MNLLELDRALRTLRLSGMADTLEQRLRHAQAERLPPLDLVAAVLTGHRRMTRISKTSGRPTLGRTAR